MLFIFIFAAGRLEEGGIFRASPEANRESPPHRRVPTVSNRSARIYPRLPVEFRFDQLLRVP